LRAAASQVSMPRMKKTLVAAPVPALVAAMIVCACATTAMAGGLPNSIGVGADFQLSGIGGLSVNYDTGKFHAGGFLGYFDPRGPNNTTVDFGGRFFYHIAATASSDFSIGGSLGIQSINDAGNPNNRDTNVFLEPSFQIRVFVVPNVALSFAGGLEIGAADASELNLTGQIIGEGSIHYYF
jgi:hypothetical protein